MTLITSPHPCSHCCLPSQPSYFTAFTIAFQFLLYILDVVDLHHLGCQWQFYNFGIIILFCLYNVNVIFLKHEGITGKICTYAAAFSECIITSIFKLILLIVWNAHSILVVLTIPIDGLSLLNEDGGLSVFFPNNSFVTNSTLTHTNTPRNGGNDHIVCYGMGQFTTAVAWHNSSGERLEQCDQTCQGCGTICRRNGGVTVDPTLFRHTHIHMYTISSAYVNQDLECRLLGAWGPSLFIGVYLKDGGESCIVVCTSDQMTNYTALTTQVSGKFVIPHISSPSMPLCAEKGCSSIVPYDSHDT